MNENPPCCHPREELQPSSAGVEERLHHRFETFNGRLDVIQISGHVIPQRLKRAWGCESGRGVSRSSVKCESGARAPDRQPTRT